MSGDVRTIKVEPFATELNQFIKRFEVNKMCDFLESYLENE